MFFVTKGRVRLFRVNPDNGEVVVLRWVNAGQWFGERGVLFDEGEDDTVYEENAIATADCLLLVLNRNSFRQLTVIKPSLCNSISLILSNSCLPSMLSLPLFASLSPEEASDVSQLFSFSFYQPGDYVFREGENYSSFLFVLYGELKEGNGGKVLRKGDAMGELSLIHSKCVTQKNIVAAQMSVCLTMSAQDVASLIYSYPSTYACLKGVINKRIVEDLRLDSSLSALSSRYLELICPLFSYSQLSVGDVLRQELDPLSILCVGDTLQASVQKYLGSHDSRRTSLFTPPDVPELLEADSSLSTQVDAIPEEGFTPLVGNMECKNPILLIVTKTSSLENILKIVGSSVAEDIKVNKLKELVAEVEAYEARMMNGIKKTEVTIPEMVPSDINNTNRNAEGQMLHLTIVEGKCLLGVAGGSSCNAFVTVVPLDRRGREIVKEKVHTASVCGSVNPSWQETIIFGVKSPLADISKIVLKVKSYRGSVSIGIPVDLGEVEFDVESLVKTYRQPIEEILPLQKRKTQKAAVSGSVKVRIKMEQKGSITTESPSKLSLSFHEAFHAKISNAVPLAFFNKQPHTRESSDFLENVGDMIRTFHKKGDSRSSEIEEPWDNSDGESDGEKSDKASVSNFLAPT
jgi:CRP-like cAMP-binding protein